MLGELRGAGQQLAVGGHDHRVTVEDQLVLAADHVHVRDRRPGLGSPAPHQRQAYVVLVQLVRRAVDVHDQADPGVPGHRERPAGLPQVLADGQRHIHRRRVCRTAAGGQPHHGQGVARHEVPVLVEHAVVRQVVLEVAGRHPATEQQGRRVARAAGPLRVGRHVLGHRVQGGAGERLRPVGVQIAHHDRQVAETVVGQVGGEPVERRPGGRHERPPEDQVLHRVSGQHHLREGHKLGAGVGGGPGVPPDHGGVAGHVPDCGVDLGKGDAHVRHVLIFPQPAPAHPSPGAGRPAGC
jgi:hypothetical protein